MTMRKIFNDVRSAWRAWRFAVSTRRNIRRNARLTKEAEARVQVREFGGQLCLSIDGVPLLPMATYNTLMLQDARTTLYNYLKGGRP